MSLDIAPIKELTTESISSKIISTNSPDSALKVDYVIVFQYPIKVDNCKEEEGKVINSLQNIIRKLSKANLLYEVINGENNGTILILVGCPFIRLYKEFKTERIRDFLLGIKVDDSDINKKDSKEVEKSLENELSEAVRLRLVYNILTSSENHGGADISPNVDPYVESIMPLHNDDYNKKWVSTWSKKWLISNEDLMNIRNQFGEKVAFYFAFVQFYLLWLSFPTILGVFVYFTHSNTLTVWYSVAMLAWGITFIEMWKRKQTELAITWEVRNCSKHEKRRADFKGDTTVADQVTGEEMPFVPAWKIIYRRALSLPGVAIGAVLLFIIVALVFMLQLFLHEYYTGPFHEILHYAPTITFALLIPTMSGIYTTWVRILTNYEMHKTESSWEYSYTQKIFVANFLVGYLSLFFIAWIYIPFGDYVLPYLSALNISHHHKKVDFQRLHDQFVYFIVTGQVVGFMTEMAVPYAKALLMPKAKELSAKVTKDSSALSKRDEAMSSEGSAINPAKVKFVKKVYKEVGLEEYNIYTDYVEMVIQFGYISMFSPVWPLASLCCIINNWIELRSDAIKICKYTRRPAPLRAEGVGPWLGNMEAIVWLSSITMGSFIYLFHPTTNIHSSYTPLFTLFAILISEHLYVAILFTIRSIVSLIPSWSELMIKKEDYKLKQLWLQKIDEQKEDGLESVTNSIGELKDQEYYNDQTKFGIQIIQKDFKNE
ncbi:unnamed protein product [Cunninghamella echinulata]